MNHPSQPKANGRGSYRSPYWYWPVMEGTGKKSPWDKIANYHVMLERLENPEWQGQNLRSCFYEGDKKKLSKLQNKFEKDMLGRVILLRLDVVMIANKIERFTYIPLYYKGVKLVLQCVERPDSRAYAKAEDLIVISDQIKANEERHNIKWEYIPGRYGRLPDFKATILNNELGESQ